MATTSQFKLDDYVYTETMKTYMYISNKEDGSRPYFSTNVLRLSATRLPKELVFPVAQQDEPELHQFVSSLENDVISELQELSSSHMMALKEKCPGFYGDVQDRVNRRVSAPLLKPFYRESKDEPGKKIAFLKAIPDVDMYYWNGDVITDANLLGAGDYQFVIKYALLYFGAHPSNGAICSLQGRIISLRFNPIEHSCTFLWDFESNLPAKRQAICKSNSDDDTDSLDRK